MPVLLSVPLQDVDDVEHDVVFEADTRDLYGGLTLAAPDPGQVATRATRSIADALDALGPMLTTIKEKLASAGPEQFTVEFGLKFGGETGIIIAKGTAEVNLTVTMSWQRT